MWTVSLPLQTGIVLAQPGWTWLHGMGIILWAVGVLFESIGDLQLARFTAKAQNAGQVMNRGLWRYTRHPNYFGDFLVWWGLYAVAIAHGAAVWAIVGPAVMTLFLMRISGVTLLEQSLQQTRPGYADYIRETSAFFPWFPARRADS
jgi:steroid 5-alpha reductase family enzyme